MKAYERTVLAEGTPAKRGHRRIVVTMPEETFYAVRHLAAERHQSFAKVAREILKRAADDRRGRR